MARCRLDPYLTFEGFLAYTERICSTLDDRIYSDHVHLCQAISPMQISGGCHTDLMEGSEGVDGFRH